nr:hypothetical protein [Kofleriaceae bacterium]
MNELIDLARIGKSLGDDGDDFMFRPPAPAQAPAPMPVAAAPRPATIPAANVPRPVPSSSFDVGALSSAANVIPSLSGPASLGAIPSIASSLRSTRTGLPPPVPARPPTQPPAFTRNRPEGTPAPELLARSGSARTAIPVLPQGTPAPQMLAQPVAAPETLPAEAFAPTSASHAIPASPLAQLASTQLAPESLPPDELAVDMRDASEELPMQPLPPLPVANLPPLPVAMAPAATLPPPTRMPVAAPFELQVPRAPVLPPATLDDGVDIKVDQSVDENGWFESSRVVSKVDETWAGTVPVEKIALAQAASFDWKKLRAPLAIGAAVLAVFVFGYLAFDGESAKHDATAKPAAADTAKVDAKPEVTPAATAAPAAQPAAPAVAAVAAPAAPAAPTTAPVVQQPAATGATPAFVDIRIDSAPSGATVMLVDGGKTSFLGTTPMTASVDVSHRYDVVFTLADHPTMLQHLDPSQTKHLVAAMVPTGAAPATPVAAPPAQAPAQAPAAPAVHHTVSQPAVAHTETPRARPAAPQPPRVAAASEDDNISGAGGQGTLMVASKPPCEIFVDGRDTGMLTPQRSIQLPVGAHKVTLVNKAESISKSVAIRITADTPTKLIKNFE